MNKVLRISLLPALALVALSSGTAANALPRDEQLEAARRAYAASDEVLGCGSDKEYDDLAKSIELFRDAWIELLNDIGEPAP